LNFTINHGTIAPNLPAKFIAGKEIR
jgi:hypothetical protein